MSTALANRIARVTEDRATRLARVEWTGGVSPAAMDMARAHVRKSQAGFGIVAVGMASALVALAVVASVVFA